MYLPNIAIILSRASDSGNVGAVCRAMKNMGLSQLRLVSPAPLDEKIVRARALHAADMWEGAQFFDTLGQAAEDCSLLIGTTRRRGRHRKSISMEPRALAQWLAGKGVFGMESAAGPVALVFGNERTGLDDSELALCNAASHIPVSEHFPSLNLSHAVQVYAYELFLAFNNAALSPVKGEWTPLERRQVDELVAGITDTLSSLGFYKHPGREEQTRFLCDLVSRAGLSEREGRYLANIFAKAGRLGTMQ
ncbi:MAG: TrmJ/YjtD family RNA methyltransferase [Treponema sp.]|jgi:tRNA/rRNA methyltransferase/tRNA (cytidine32/uridine32-2'-O)-methyltransferase|nr:TrmJ/YjtD family RNA methyltransferase [Treponema sp.]